MPDDDGIKQNAYEKFYLKVFGIIDAPVTYFKEKVVEPLHEKNKTYYYHRRLRRVPTIDECDVGDEVCFFEANEQYKRDKNVDDQILIILRERRLECEHWYGLTDREDKCRKVREDYETATTNWFTKYGDLGPAPNVRAAYFKQKHRMIWERRHGPVGTGMGSPPVEQ
ncbi:hypothetical protein NP493_875g00074 [Ridgeia piscesae]|uniref:NADH dehydrogenase [ubiquinone] 1 beta subcomplex subunit 10 n=1 Tax=Ridgeia piscesae TaxID=27915 RepID=A0AAD9NKA5_RIDPI|nr:hypothetical protein NP493_875g00074 [Ridgeia piscesae]